MKKILLLCAFVISMLFVKAQTTYYWVGSSPSAANNNISTNSNWNTAQNGTGSARASSTGASDILIFDGANLGGATTVTGPVTVNCNTSITCAQIKFTGNVTINMPRPTTGTSTVTMNGEVGEDWVIEAGSTFNVPVTTSGSMRFAMAAANSGRVSGTMSIISTQQFRIDNTTAGTGTILFTSGSSFITNITGASSYAFGSSTQSTERWVVFEAGSHLYFAGGNSPAGSGSLYSAVDMKPGSTWHHQANNAGLGGNFFNRKYFGNISVESNSTLTASGPIFQIGNLTIASGSSFVTSNSGPTAVVGNLIVDGSLTGPSGGFNELLFSGTGTQTVSGTGSIAVNSLIVGDNANVVLSKIVSVDQSVTVNGKLNFGTNQLTGAANFKAEGIIAPAAGTANAVNGSYQLSGNTGIGTSSTRGQRITGTGIPLNTVIIGFSTTGDTIYVSNPLTASGSGVALTVSTSGATLTTANTNGFNPTTGSVIVAGSKNYADNISYVINAATLTPFGVTTGSVDPRVRTVSVDINAAVTVNKTFSVSNHLLINGKLTLRPLDTAHVLSGATITGTFNSSNYIATDYNPGNGDQSLLQYDGLASAVTLPIGTIGNYLPVSLTPVSSSNFRVAVFEGITYNGTITGTPFLPSEKQNVVNAVWNINRIAGTGSSNIQLGWTNALEGSTFATLPGTDIGIITNNGSSWSVPIGTGNNTTNTAPATVSSFGAFGVGAIPQTQPFIFNALPPKTYGNPDFNGGATSLNTTKPIIYTSSNPQVATIVSGNIHITGAGTSIITATQESDGFYPAASMNQTLTVSKAPLTITADNKTKFQGQANPTLTITYTGLVLGETAAALLTPAVISTTAVTASPAGTYPITVSGATSNNYTITFVNGTLTVQPQQTQTITFAAPAVKTYGNPDFASGATSTNSTIPVILSSSNTNVATIIGTNIHIVGAGTANITASQAGNAGYFPATDVVRALTVNKVNLAIRVRDTTKVQGEVNPPFTITYTGFVLGETSANLLTPVVASTTAMTNSSPGNYPITLSGATSNNYTITLTNGRLTILPLSGTTTQYFNAYMSNATTLTVRVYSPSPALGDVIVYDINGRPLLKRNLFMPVGFISMDIPVSILSSGMYVVTIQGDGVDLKKTIRILK